MNRGGLLSPCISALLLAAVACSAGADPQPAPAENPSRDDAGSAVDASVASQPPSTDASTAPADPFAPQPDTSEGLTNVSADLDAVLEHGALRGACDAYEPGVSDRHAMLLCGKSMFFYEGFGTAGVPKTIADFLVAHFPSQIGSGFQKLGMIADPTSSESLPLGMAPGAKLGGSIDTLAFTCASCHFAKLPDGRYAAGAPNHSLEYGKLNLALAVFPTAALLGTSNDDPDAIAVIQPLLDAVNADSSLKSSLTTALLPLLGSAGSAPSFPAQAQHLYASWKPGTMDFFIEPLPYNDHVHTISKISALWGIPTDAEISATGMHGAMLGWTGSTSRLLHFAESFVDLGGGTIADWPDSKLAPLVAYVESLRAPNNPDAPDTQLVAGGRALFTSKGCIDCHGGPRGSGKVTYAFDEIGTDPAIARWTDPDLTGQPQDGIHFPQGDVLTHQMKSPRLVGAWAFGRFLHNGSVDSLERLLCMDAARGDVTALAYGNQGHTMTCDGLSDAEKKQLVAFLRTL